MLKQQVLNTINKYNMLQEGDRVLVAVSGGPDSTALLLVLHGISKELKLKLFAASLNHMFRKEAGQDIAFVEKLAGKLKIPVITEKIDVSSLWNQKGGSKEDLARGIRYDFLKRIAQKTKANRIALGHTKDDQAETVLMRLIYGAGITGLSGIPPTRILGRYLIVRPLIETTRDEINLYLKENKVKARIDATNYQDVYKRNKIRRRLIPFLEKGYNPNIKEALSRTASLLRDDRDLLEEVLLKEVFRNLIKRDKKNMLRLNLKKFDKLHTALKKYILRECIRRVNLRLAGQPALRHGGLTGQPALRHGGLAGIEYRHWKLLEDFIRKRKNNTSWHLPHGCRTRIKRGNIFFYNEGMKLRLH